MLRNLIRSSQNHDWFTSVTEFILLVVGIFVGFQLDRWNGDRIQQNEADAYGIQLLDDLNAQQQEMQLRVSYYTNVMDWGMKALTAWDTEQSYSPEQIIIAFYQASNEIPASSFRGTYDALTSQGLAILIDGPEFASRLSAFYSQPLDQFLQAESPFREGIRSLLPIEVQEAVRDNCGSVSSDGLVIETLLQECSIDISPGRASALLHELIQDPNLQRQLRFTVSNNSLYQYVLDIKIQDTANIRATLIDIYGL